MGNISFTLVQLIIFAWLSVILLGLLLFYTVYCHHKKVENSARVFGSSKDDIRKAWRRKKLGTNYKIWILANWILLSTAFFFTFVFSPYVCNFCYSKIALAMLTRPFGWFTLYFIFYVFSLISVGLFYVVYKFFKDENIFIVFYEECPSRKFKKLSSLVVSLLLGTVVFSSLYFSTTYPNFDTFTSVSIFSTILLFLIASFFLVFPVLYEGVKNQKS